MGIRNYCRRVKSSNLVLSRVQIWLSILLVSAITFIAATPAFAATDPKGWVGGVFGLSIPNADNTTARPMFGISGGAKLGSEWGIGAYYLSSDKEEDVTAGLKAKFGYELYGLEFAYHFEGEASGVYLGGRVGTSKVKATVAGVQASTSPTNYGAVAGYNHFLSDHFSLGGEASFMSIPESGSTDGFTMLNFLGTAKAWF